MADEGAAQVLEARVAPVSGARSLPRRLVAVTSVLALAATVFFLFWKLDWIGMTWDELTAFGIVRSYIPDLANILGNTTNASQGRLNYTLAIPLMAWLGPTIEAFKLTFVFIALGCILALWLALKKAVRPVTALALAAVLASTPVFIGAGRTAANSGDVLTMLAIVLYIWTLARWTVRRREHDMAAVAAIACGIASGVAIGSKLTDGLLIPAAIVWIGQTLGWKKSLRDFSWYLPVTALVAVAAHPLFLLGPAAVISGIRDADGFDHAAQFYLLGHYVKHPQWYFPLADLLAKTSIPLFAFFVWAAFAETARSLKARSLDPWVGVAALVFGLDYLFVFKGFQGAHYYQPAVVAMVFISAPLLDRLLSSARRRTQILAALGVALTLAYQVGLDVWLAPDFLQAGRQFGDTFQGEFSGPAVNHCQGGPGALASLNRLEAARHYGHAYVLVHCGPVLNADSDAGPVRSVLHIDDYPYGGPSARPYWLLISHVYDYYSYGSPQAQRDALARRARVVQDCTLASGTPDSSYEIYACPAVTGQPAAPRSAPVQMVMSVPASLSARRGSVSGPDPAPEPTPPRRAR